MSRYWLVRMFTCAALSGSCAAHAQVDDAQSSAAWEKSAEAPLRLTGYNKTLLISSTTADPEKQPYTLVLNRLRLKLTDRLSPSFLVHAEEDVVLKGGSYLDTMAFQRERSAPVRQYWGDGSAFADKSGYYGTQHLFRGYARISSDTADLTIGRQRIPLGTGRLWSALDMLNPANPLQVERDDYVGVDAALMEYKTGALSKFSLVYAPDPDRVSDRWIGQYRTNVKGTDITVSYGKYWEDRLAGMDFATQIGDAGLRGEWAYFMPQNGAPYRKILLGFDYAFANTLTLSAEAYYSSQSDSERLAQFAQHPQRMQVQPFGSRYAGLSATYEFTPLLKASAYFLFNLSDHSRFVAPSLSYLLADNLSVMGGVQLFAGDGSSEYGRGNTLRYVQLQWFY
jgi:hypothetical protein